VGVAEDDAAAVARLGRGAEAGHVPSQLALGLAYRRGESTKEDAAEQIAEAKPRLRERRKQEAGEAS